MDKLLTITEIAERLALSTDCARRWCREGIIPAFRLGTKNYRCDARDLDAFIQAQKTVKAGVVS